MLKQSEDQTEAEFAELQIYEDESPVDESFEMPVEKANSVSSKAISILHDKIQSERVAREKLEAELVDLREKTAEIIQRI